jgi:hypothetical protein
MISVWIEHGYTHTQHSHIKGGAEGKRVVFVSFGTSPKANEWQRTRLVFKLPQLYTTTAASYLLLIDIDSPHSYVAAEWQETCN